MRKKPASVFLKLLVLFFAVTAPMYFFSLLINIWGINDVNHKTMESIQSKIDFFVDTMDREIEIAMKLQKDLINNSALVDLSMYGNEIEQFDYIKSTKAIQEKILKNQEVCTYVAHTAIYIPKINKKISDTEISDLDSNELISFMKSNPVSYSPGPLIVKEGHIFLNLTSMRSKQNQSENNIPRYIISLEISKDQLKKTMSRLIDQGKIFLIGDNYEITSSDDSEKPEEDSNVKNYAVKLGEMDGGQTIQKIKIAKSRYFITGRKISILHANIVILLPEAMLSNELNQYKLWIGFTILFTLLMILLFSIFAYNTFAKPLNKLVDVFKKIGQGNMNLSVAYEKNDDFGYIFEGFNNMIKQIRSLIEEVYEQGLLVKSAELKQLQYQINPHFLYNSLFNVYRMVKGMDYQKAEMLSEFLGKYYLYITKGVLQDVPLINELNHARNYVEIQSLRFGKRIKIEFDQLLENYERLPVPKLIIQPVLENAFEHGLKNKVEDALLRVGIVYEEKTLRIFAEDNGAELQEKDLEDLKQKLSNEDKDIECTGLINVHRRIQIRFGIEYGLNFEKSNWGGLKVSILIPLDKANQ